ncbi:hypothetical protein B6D19_12645 [Gilliamella apicola]|uniref:DUF7079 family protein n=1 Tax=Gilliamella apicola TaxID=1196095 RepID=UPI000A342DA9|nr:hypothetical protein [Gilliamella apicola]OTQ28970.1 hypothetical protein B6D19_12645 [Gilliamella apicola]OTQ36213.1 hypothetical protein B6D20_12600 [Gilliamella apicola]
MEHTLNEEDLYIALSDLFVDNEVDYNHIASVAKLFPTSYVEHALFNYVAPYCYHNMLTPVPSVCYFFDEDELLSAIDNIKKKKIVLPISKIKMRILAFYLKFRFKDEWQKIKSLL